MVSNIMYHSGYWLIIHKCFHSDKTSMSFRLSFILSNRTENLILYRKPYFDNILFQQCFFNFNATKTYILFCRFSSHIQHEPYIIKNHGITLIKAKTSTTLQYLLDKLQVNWKPLCTPAPRIAQYSYCTILAAVAPALIILAIFFLYDTSTPF